MLEIDNVYIKATEKTIQALNASDLDGLLLFGYDNIQYVSGAFLPFLPYRKDLRTAAFISKGGEAVYICPAELASSVKKSGRIHNIRTYVTTGNCPSAFLAAVKDTLGESKKIGIDCERISHSLFTALKETAASVEFEGADALVADLRKVKCESEIDLLSQVAYVSDHGINGVLHHAMGNNPRSMLGLAEEVRVHEMERGLYSGYNSIAHVTGHEMNSTHFPKCKSYGFNYGFSPIERLSAYDLCKIRYDGVSDGYWSNSCRLFHYKAPNEDQIKTYEKWFEMRNYMLSIIKPGVKCCDVWKKTNEYAESHGITLDPKTLLGHAVGVTPVEGPFFEADDSTEISEDMILVISPAVMAGEESIQSNDTIRITADGNVVLNWWKDWREPYTGIAEL